MQKTIEVVYEDGVFKPLEPVKLEEGEKARIEIKREKKFLDKREKTRKILDKMKTFSRYLIKFTYAAIEQR